MDPCARTRIDEVGVGCEGVLAVRQAAGGVGLVPGLEVGVEVALESVVVGGGVRYEGRKLLPDVDERCEEVAGYITPRLGGVGPTTIAMLFRNAVEAAERGVAKA